MTIANSISEVRPGFSPVEEKLLIQVHNRSESKD